VVIEREPIVGGRPVQGHEFGEEEEETFTLYEERPVVGTESTPVERVRMHKERVSRDETVHGKVRKERFEVDQDGETVDEGDQSLRDRPLPDQPRRDERRRDR
jgi:stress response protein YsnF